MSNALKHGPVGLRLAVMTLAECAVSCFAQGLVRLRRLVHALGAGFSYFIFKKIYFGPLYLDPAPGSA